MVAVVVSTVLVNAVVGAVFVVTVVIVNAVVGVVLVYAVIGTAVGGAAVEYVIEFLVHINCLVDILSDLIQ